MSRSSVSLLFRKLFPVLATGFLLLTSFISSTSAKCGGKTILKALNGTITDGSGKYPKDKRCEWLIEAPRPNMSITLVFLEYSTECSFDYLFIYDGPSYRSSLIGSFSGNTLPEKLVAISGKMLINLYSDTNYVLEGFTANYTIENCPKECSGHGSCLNGQCTCSGPWHGKACDIHWCPENCNMATNNGMCDTSQHHCSCKQGYVGESCSVSVFTNDGANSWYKMDTYSTQFTHRLGHAAVYYILTDTIWSFGGYDLNSASDDLLKFNLTTAQWTKVTTPHPHPVGRYSHTASLYHDSILIFGGQFDDQHLTNELWMLNLTTLSWTQLSANDPNVPLPVTQHTANLVDDKLYIYGGHTNNESFSSAMYKYDLSKANTGWTQVKYKSGKETALQVLGHSTVYYEDTRSLVVFGGFSPKSLRESTRKNKLHIFHVDELVWTEWILTGDSNIPKPRSFHSGTIVGDYMVVYGGNRHEHNKDETCYDNDIHFFNLKCRKWISMGVFSQLSAASPESMKPQRGRFSHVTLLRESLLIIFGGYNGAPLSDMYAYKLPVAVAVENTTGKAVAGGHCDQYLTSGTCVPDPACGWCGNQGKCFSVENSTKCLSDWKTENCLGQCGVLSQCLSCLTWGLKHTSKCGWCVQDSQCYPVTSPQNACETLTSSNTKKIGGWWGASGQFLTGSVDQCRSSDYPPGLTTISHKTPENTNHPDDVSIVSSSTDLIVYHHLLWNKILYKNFVGFIYPYTFRTAPWSSFFLRVFTKNKYLSRNTLYLSTDDKKSNSEMVAQCDFGTLPFSCSARAFRPNKELFPSPGQDKKYYMKMKGEIRITPSPHSPLVLEASWNGSSDSLYFTPISGHYLQPYTSGGSECTTLTNCMLCMTDASCGWCKLTNTCVSRSSSTVCENNGHVQHLVLNATECFRCSDFTDCASCVQQSLCEWLPNDNACFRRGRTSVPLIRDPAKCNLPCHRRTGCSSCVADKLGCAWCEKTSSCFIFGSYIAQYPYGQCTHWIDSKTSPNCRNCSSHKTCKACLADIECGWCGSTDNPLIGSCFGGDFQGPSNGQCSSLVNISDSVDWSYSMCSDVNECRLGLHNCHHNATCHNVYDSYNCVCNRGFTGDGKIACNKTCYNPCIHGTCGPDYTCQCDLGWLGENCTIDCGCNGHSSCNQGIGICDKCQDYTHGNHCELCVRGSYGNATSPQGCKKCDCNGHGDVAQGECDMATGICFCTDNTVGEHCDKCLPGLKGDPRNGGRCYYECSGRSVLTNVTQGDISTFVGQGVTDRTKASCLWVISSSMNTSHNVIYESQPVRHRSSITLDFMNMSLDCLTDHVDVYDGLPSFILGSVSPYPPLFYKLGSFCGPEASLPKVTATLGNMVVFFQGDISQEQPSNGFGAVFTVHSCTDSCHGNRQCVMKAVGESCVCRDGWIGTDCTRRVCPNDCSSALGRGVCNKETALCECTAGFTGVDCSIILTPGKGSWETLFDNPYPNSSYSNVARMAHTMVLHSNHIWIYGGFSLAMGILSDVMKYDVVGKTWSHVTTNQLALHLPSARYFHCAVIYQDTMVVHGGLTKTGVSSELWHFNVVSPSWTSITTLGPTPKVAGHTCTLVGSVITIIGGYEPSAGLNSRVYQYSITSKTWTILQSLGIPPTGLYGHSTVYNARTQSLFVFGGYGFKTNEVRPSSELYSLHLPSRTWSVLEPLPNNKPSPKFFHAATILDDVMIIYGGRNTTDQFSSELLVYRVNCSSWRTFTNPDSNMAGISPGGLIGASASANHTKTYLFGGFDGQTRSTLHRLGLPSDMCKGLRDKAACTATIGCNWCELHYTDHSLNESTVVNGTACYSVTSALPSVCHATPNVTHAVVVNGSACNVAAAEQRDCETYSSCGSCLGPYPGGSSSAPRCKWCMSCLGAGKCVGTSVDCNNTDSCGVTQSERTSLASCPETKCRAPTCAECLRGSSCMWTPQLKYLADTQEQMPGNRVAYPWMCYESSLKSKYQISISIESTPDCPRNCTQFTDCRSCLDATGGDGGWKECVWSESLGQCFSPSYLPMAEITGSAGRVLRGSSHQCMSHCALRSQCSTCFQNYNCGWCSKKNSNGIGLCMEGGLEGPLYGTCKGNTIDIGQQISDNVTKHISTLESPVWAYSLCPLEDECLNNRHNCTSLQNCINTDETFICVCKPGYKQIGRDNCEPICDDGCVHGKCISPNNCSCSFGWTSTNCSIKCQCNEHGRCLSEASLDTCVDCRNHTTGKSCQFCAPLYVGNASNNGTCQSCYEVCNRSADVCMDKASLIKASNMSLSLDPKEVLKWLDHGPTVIDEDGECLCKDKSQGVRCKNCIPGNFFENSRCSPCRCNGHGDVCSEEGRCVCQNNTEQDCRSSEPCYKTQCIKCKDTSKFLGRPENHRQCYYKVIHMQEFVIGAKPGLVDNSVDSPALPKGTTLSYVIYPRYTNVDIRTTIDVFQGGLDVYVSTFDRTFAVYVNKTTWTHKVVISNERRYRRDIGDSSGSTNVADIYAGKEKLNTFVRLYATSGVFRVRDVHNRLVITFPYTSHSLSNSRFYMIFVGVGDSTHSDTTGIVYFRQDLSQIDLFVFFSVFFSVFFLVLSMCIVTWKIKQFHDRRRIAQVQERELVTMASRPFATYSFLTDMKSAPRSCWKIKRENSKRSLRERKSLFYLKDASNRPVISPVALQTAHDSKAAITSVMFQLPSNECSDFQLAFGSAITATNSQHSLGVFFGHQLLSGHKVNTRQTVTVIS